MENFTRLTKADVTKYTKHRSGEIKFGERLLTVPDGEDIIGFIKSCAATFVVFGIPEDIGVRANFGRPGAYTSWDAAVKSIVNLQHNKFCKANNLLMLGHINSVDAMQEAKALNVADKEDRQKLSALVDKLDKDVSHVVSQILLAGKIPVIIGGGHNNAYGNIKGAALAKGRPVNAINFDAHANFRIPEGRHSGNGFTYAFNEGFLKNYFIFGLHEGYTSKVVMENIKKNAERIKYNTYEQIAVRKQKSFSEEMALAQYFIADDVFGIEMDMDALPNIASSAITPSGFSVEKARQFIHYFGKSPNALYLHICEGAPNNDDVADTNLVGKLIACFVTDFMKAKSLS
ncbi:formimidoylglutamase [Flavobacterium rhizosphaerae]|uniref:Formimidoylglutamase n=1 Tax=Flavobacterium rhizosphaerae TaxID=3163298 RepID=A0ABW8YSW3_9FLAO